ncbi:LuxR family transcriptional regulator [Rhizobium sp. FKY42]|uniref:LuxR family transcriptional regulator n=1 Tax=Rhizobium sp. FKY42 TaxID=2562310 RepID=UPI0010BFAD60|nr:LuxR family transcriptional regulator [Rhizobium sp. FKY42]
MRHILYYLDPSVTVEQCLLQIRDHYEVSHVTYNFFRFSIGGLDNPWVKTTYPASWVGSYITRGYVSIDPVVRFGKLRDTPFQWSDLKGEAGYDEVFGAALDYGIGSNGFSIPISDTDTPRAMLSISSMANDCDWQAMAERHFEDWVALASAVHERAVIEAFGHQSPRPRLSQRELQCLEWAARGKAAKEIAAILEISHHTARAYLKAVRQKLDCTTISQAVASAIRYQLIEP